jgi:hypothetical protein
VGIEAVGNDVFRINHDDEDTNSGRSADAGVNRVRFENFVTAFVEGTTQDTWTTMRYALEHYAKHLESDLNALLLTPVENRQPGFHEEVALTSSLVSKASEALMYFNQYKQDTDADV